MTLALSTYLLEGNEAIINLIKIKPVAIKVMATGFSKSCDYMAFANSVKLEFADQLFGRFDPAGGAGGTE